MKQKYCYVVDKTCKPLAPTKKWDMIYRKLKNGTAKIVRKKPFVVQFLDKEIPEDEIVKSTLCLDPGNTTGIAVIKRDTNDVVFLGEFIADSHKISKKLKQRKEFKRRRKYYLRKKRIRRAIKCGTVFKGKKEFKFPGMKKGIKCEYIRPKSPKYHNRKKKHKYTPTVEHYLHSLLRMIKDIRKYIAIDKVEIEFVPFDIRKMQEPWIKGFWYQVSNKGDFSKWSEYVKDRDGYKCVLCGSNENLHVHHIKPISEGGKDNPRNLVTLCEKCHTTVHNDNKKFKKYTKQFEKYVKKVEKKRIKDIDTKYASYMNQIIRDIVEYLNIPVEFKSPGNTIKNREKLNLEKTHYNDAISVYGSDVNIKEDLKVFRIKQFPKHNRKITMGIEDRMYCYKPKTKESKPVAHNRRPRCHQTKPSLLDLVLEKGKEETGKLTIYRKGNIRYRSKKSKILSRTYYSI